MTGRSPAQIYALVFGVVLVAAGILGFFYNATFGAGDDVERDGDGEAIFDLIPINTEDNILHLLIGVASIGAGLASPGSEAPRTAPA